MLYLRYSAFRAGVFLLLLFMFYSADRTYSAQAESGSEVRGRVTFSNTRYADSGGIGHHRPAATLHDDGCKRPIQFRWNSSGIL